MTRPRIPLIILTLVLMASPAMLFGQGAAPQAAPGEQASGTMQPGMLLAIGRIDVKPGKDMAIEKVEHNIARLTAAKVPGMPRAVAMNAVAGPSETWFLVPLASYASLDKVMEMFPQMPAPVAAEWQQLGEQEGGLINSGSMTLWRYLDDYSHGATTDVSSYRYMLVTTYRVKPGRAKEFLDESRFYEEAIKKGNPESKWAMFSLASGGLTPTYLVLAPLKKMAELSNAAADKAIADALGPSGQERMRKANAELLVSSSTMLFAFNPTMSSAAPMFAKNDPWWAWKTAAAPAKAAVEPKPEDAKKKAVEPVKK